MKKKDDRRLLLVVAGFAGIAFLAYTMGLFHRAFSPAPTRLTLTLPGCTYLHNEAGLVGEVHDDVCTVDVLFMQNRLGSGGRIVTGQDNEHELLISEGQVVGAAALPDNSERPWTKQQRISVMCAAGAIVWLVLIMFVMFRER